MSRFKKDEGKFGEDLAVKHLKHIGYKIIDRNFLIRGGEIDIVAIDPTEGNEVLSFIEVKTRKSTRYGTPLEAISYYKLKALVKASQFYKYAHNELPDIMRIDAVAITLDKDNKPLSVELIKNISY